MQQLAGTSFITNQELLTLLQNEIDAEARETLQLQKGRYVISEYNRLTIVRMLSHVVLQEEQLETERIVSLVQVLQEYLNRYMKDQPEGHKWIILCCVFLSEIVKEPMHPQELVHWTQCLENRQYYCPAYSEEAGSTCLYCVCNPVIS